MAALLSAGADALLVRSVGGEELAEVRRAVLPLRDPVRRFVTGEVPGIDPDIQPFFRDVLEIPANLDQALRGYVRAGGSLLAISGVHVVLQC